jgi:pimeloyl-ACP methyl ester carboxylesterase
VAIDPKRFPVSARQTLFRSASYYRASDFFLHANWSDPRIDSLWASALADFHAAIKLLPSPGELGSVRAPEPNNFSVPYVFFPGATPAQMSSSSSGYDQAVAGVGGKQDNVTCKKTRRLPTLIAGTGYDGSKEALWHSYGRYVVERGWNYLVYEGPGQPQVVREQGVGFVENWWDVVTPLVDYLETRDDVDTSRIALAGFSFGGTLAPRAASREHRLSAVLAVEGLIDLRQAILQQFGTQVAGLFASGNRSAFDELMLQLMDDPRANTQARWLIAQSLWSFRTENPFDWMTRLGAIVADGPVLANITCPVFVAEGEDDSSAPGQAVEMARLLGDRATYNLFRTDLGAGEHCHLGAEAQLAQVSLDWLADVWDGIQVPRNSTNTTF